MVGRKSGPAVPGTPNWAPAVLVTLALLGAACSGAENPRNQAASATPSVEAGESSPTPDPGTTSTPIVGEWERILQCEELVPSLREAGLHDYVPELVWGSFFWPEVATIEEFSFDPKDPCKGAEPRLHSHFFTADGEFGSRDEHGAQVDDGIYELVGKDRLIINGSTFRYRIRGDVIRFDPILPDCTPCFGALWMIAVASPGGAWTRVS
jgi:hypothetical protein